MQSLILVLSLLLGAPALAGEEVARGPPAEVLAVRNVEVTFHPAGSVLPEKKLDLMMSIYAQDAVLTDTAHDNKVYRGKAEVRRYWEDVSGPFRPEHHWIGYTPAIRMHARIEGDKATLYFECLWMDADSNVVGAHSFSDMKLARVHGRWLVRTIAVGKVDKL